MVFSNSRKLSLSGWLQENDIVAYNSPLKFQKFLFFYEALSKINNEETDFTKLKGYQRGPVFSQVWGDYTKDRKEFDEKSKTAYNSGDEDVNQTRARRAKMIVNSLSENELSLLTHQFHIWDKKKTRIMGGEQQVELEEQDFDEDDILLTQNLERMFPDEIVDNYVSIVIGDKCFLFSKEDCNRLSAQHFDILTELSKNADLHNPVYVEIEADGRLCLD